MNSLLIAARRGIVVLGYVAIFARTGIATAEDAKQPESLQLGLAPPKSPQESLAAIEVKPGFRVELVAAEPLIHSPVDAAFDEDGRMYVVEYPEYNDHAATRPHGKGSIRLLEDRDDDGACEHSVVFADGIDHPSGVLCYAGGVIVASAPDVLYLKDTDGDGCADVRERWFTGLLRDHAGEAMLNSLRWGLDQRVHFSSGLVGGMMHRADDANDKPRSVRNMGVAFDPRSRDWWTTGGGGQYGMTFDDWGHKFVCSNSTPAWQIMYDNRYVARNAVVLAPNAAVPIVPDGKSAHLHRISPVEGWRIARDAIRQREGNPNYRESGLVSGVFTAASGITVYRGDAYGPEYRNTVFVGEVANNLVHRSRLEPDGLAFKAVPADEGAEFLASNDTWFRPAQFAASPDGCLCLMDMCRGLIEGADFLPGEVLKHVDPSAGVDRGRIYRVVPEGFTRRKRPQLSRASIAELVALLEHDDGWHRDTAGRLLSERRDQSAVEPLRQLARKSDSPLARMHALYVLASLDALTADDVLIGLNDASSEVREHALILSERHANNPDILARVVALAGDGSIRLRNQAAYSLGAFAGDAATEAIARLAFKDGDNPWIRLGVLCSSAGRAGTLLEKLADNTAFRTSATGQTIVAALARQIGAADKDVEVQKLLAVIDAQPAAEEKWSKNVMRQFMSGRPSRAKPLSLSGSSKRLWDETLASALKAAIDETRKDSDRAAAVQSIVLLPWADAKPTLARLLEPTQPEPVQSAVLQAIGRYSEAEVGEMVLAQWSSLSPKLRSSAIELLLQRAAWAERFLDAVEAKQIARAEVDPGRVQLLQSFPHKKVRERARAIFADSASVARPEVVAHYRPALTMTGELARGREVFRKQCTACHRLENEGRAVGADLAAIGDRGVEAVLLNILDPNREVKPKYLVYVLATQDGQIYTGLITGETATSVTLEQADGTRHTILRNDIDQLQNTGRSFMPEGIEKQIDVQAMADLLAYLIAKK
jgi:putative membrane-bound dehydrogenase-like protein